MTVRAVDRERRSAGKILMCPCIGKDMHRDTDMLKALARSEIDSVFDERTVGSADQTVFVLIVFAGTWSLRIQVFGQEMERRPDPRDVLKADDVAIHVEELCLRLACGSVDSSMYGLKESLGTAVDELVAVADGQRFLMRIPRDEGCTICCIVVKVSLHAVCISFEVL